jgi:hypothetical protein
LKAKRASDSTAGLDTINIEAHGIVQRVVADTQLPIAGRYDTRILGVPFGLGNRQAWGAQLNEGGGATIVATGELIANWPHSVDETTIKAAEESFMSSIASGTHVAQFICAAAKLVTAAEDAPDCSRIVQVGLTIHVDVHQPKSFYIQGIAVELAEMSNSDIMDRCEPAQ